LKQLPDDLEQKIHHINQLSEKQGRHEVKMHEYDQALETISKISKKQRDHDIKMDEFDQDKRNYHLVISGLKEHQQNP